MSRNLIPTGSPFEKTVGYSCAFAAGDECFVSGTTGYDYDTMTMPEDVSEQTRNALATVGQALEEADFSFQDVAWACYVVTDRAHVQKVFAASRLSPTET